MGYNSWMNGTVTLPAAEVSKVRAVLNDAHESRRVATEKHAARLWEKAKSVAAAKRAEWFADPANYHGAIFAAETRWPTWSPRWWAARHHNDDVYVALHLFRLTGGRKPTAADYARAGLAPATNRRNEWREDNLAVSLHGRHLAVDVREGRNAIEYADNTRLGRALFGHLDQVRWTARSGGVLEGGDDGGDYPATYAARHYESDSERARRIKAEVAFAEAMYR